MGIGFFFCCNYNRISADTSFVNECALAAGQAASTTLSFPRGRRPLVSIP
jgi:hypothetical protein